MTDRTAVQQAVITWKCCFRPRRWRKEAALLQRIVRGAPKCDIKRLQLLAYLVEVEHYRFWGKRLTHFCWVKGRHGPVALEFWLLVNEMLWRGQLVPIEVTDNA